MSTALREHQYELLPADDEEGLVFGTEDTGYLTLTRPQHASGELRSDDLSRPNEDGLMFSRDYVGGKSVGFEMSVLTDINNGVLAPPTPAAAHQMNLDYLDILEGWWKDPRWRDRARALAVLRACEDGVRTWRAYGRPRRYDEVVGALTRQGYSNVVCDFQMIDDYWYSDDEFMVEAGLIAPPDGGLVAPLVAPLTTTLATDTEVLVDVGGSQPTWLVVEFTGPVLNPSVRVGDIIVALTGSLAWDESVTIDPRPWVRTALRNTDGASLAGLLSRETPKMSAMKVRPGAHMVQFRGTDATGTARVRLRWRDARKRP